MALATVPRVSGSRLVKRARNVAETVSRWWTPIQGPFTSVLVSDGGSPAWMPVSPSSAMAIGAVYSSVSRYADQIGTLPVRRYRGETVLDLPPFVDHPHGIPIGWTDEIGQVIWSLLLRGNAYLLPTSLDATGYPVTFFVADPDAVAVQVLPDGRVEYRIRWTTSSADDWILVDPSPDRLLHLRWMTPPGGLLGVGILDAAGGPGGELAGVLAAERYAADLMANPVPPAVLEHPLRLSSTQATELQDQWSTSLGRARAVPAVLSGGIKYQPLTISAADAQLIETRQWNATVVANLFRLPPYMVGGTTAGGLTYATVEGEMQRLWTDALQPMCVRLERGIGGAWTPLGQRLRFVPDAILRSQTMDRYNAHKIGLDSGFLTVAEVRAMENLPPMDTPPPALPPQPPALPPGGGT